MTQQKRTSVSFDLLGEFIKKSGHFRGKGRILEFWLKKVGKSGDIRVRALPGGGVIHCDLSVPYEAMVWLEREEQKDLEVLMQLLRPGQTFVDCGANIGLWSLVAASAVGSHGTVFSFEPNPSTVAKLRRNISEGNWENVRIIPMAVGSASGEIHFKCEADHNVSRIVTEEDRDSIPVTMTSLDSFLSCSVVGCKIDVEGAELDVLQGACRLLEKERPWLCIEFNTLLNNVDTLRDWDVHNYLRGLGYVARRFHDALDLSPATALSDGWQTHHYCNLFYSVGKE